MSLTPIMLVLTRKEDDCPHGGVCVARVEGPYEAVKGAQRMTHLLRGGWWVHKVYLDIEPHPAVPDTVPSWS